MFRDCCQLWDWLGIHLILHFTKEHDVYMHWQTSCNVPHLSNPMDLRLSHIMEHHITGPQASFRNMADKSYIFICFCSLFFKSQLCPENDTLEQTVLYDSYNSAIKLAPCTDTLCDSVDLYCINYVHIFS